MVAGQAAISSTGNTTTINQSSAKAVIDWTSFSIAKGATVNFVQPSASAVALNRVLGTDPSVIQGALNANGHVFLINPNGVLFGPTAQINVGGLLASTLSMSTDDFLAGRYHLSGTSTNTVENQGSLQASNGGNIALVAAKVVNAGQINADQGNVLLGAGNDVLVDFGGRVKLQVQKGALDALVENGGAIRADGGTVLLTAKSASELTGSVINNTGIIQARTLATGEQGQILLLGDMQSGTLKAGGTLDASAPLAGNGGNIETSAATVQNGADLVVNAGAARGTGGQWLIDPYDYTINAAAATTITNSLNQGTSVTVSTQSSNTAYGGGTTSGNGDITVASAITKSAGGDASLTLKADRNIIVNSDITSTSGKLNLTLSSANASNATVGGIDVNANLKSNGGNILIGGANGSASSGIAYALNSSSSAAAITVEQAKSILSSGGNITINGRSLVGSSSGNYSGTTAGVYILSNATIQSGTGNLLVNGESDGGSHTFGLAFEGNSNTVTSLGSSTGGGTMLLNAVNATAGATAADQNAGAIGLVSYGNRARIVFNGPSVADWLVYVNGAPQLSAYTQSPQLSSCATPYPNCGTMVVPGSNNSYLYATYQSVDMATQPVYVIQSGSGSKVYDGTVTATGLSYTTIGGPTGFAVSNLNPNPVYYTASKNAGSYNTLVPSASNPSDYTSGGTTYAVGYFNTGSYTITRKTLTPSAADKVYDGNTTAAVSVTGVVSGDTVTASGSGTFGSKDVGTYSVSVSNIVLGGTDAGNYTLSGNSASATASITPRTVTISATKGYDGSSSLPSVTLGNLVSGEDLSVGGATANSANVVSASYINAISLGNGTVGLASDYQLPSLTAASNNNSAVITPKALSISGLAAADKVYDGTLAANLSGGTLTGMVGNETLGISALSGSFADKNVGNAKTVTLSTVTLSDGTGLASNYTVAQPSGLTANITPKALTLSGLTASDKTYDGSTTATVSSAGANLQGLVAGDNVTVAASGAFADANAGTGKNVALSVSYGGVDAGNYAISGPSNAVASITPKALTISGLTASDKVYDGTTAASLSGGTLTGLVGSETLGVSGINGAFADKNAGTGKGVTLTGGTLADGSGLASNYTLTLPGNVTASITPKALTVSGITASDKIYDGGTGASVTTANASLQGLVAGDNVTVSASGAFLDKNVGSAKTVTLSSTVGGADAVNYTIQGQATTTASITPKGLTVSGITAADKVYDGTTGASVSTTNASLQGLVAGDNVTVAAGGAFTDKNAGNGKTVTLTSTHGGADAGNYTITDQSSTTANITPRALSITGMNASDKVYDGTRTATLTGGTLSGLVGSETVGFSGASGAFLDKNVGSAKTVIVTGIALTDGTGLASNYSFTQPNGLTANIIPKALTVSGITAADKTYDGTSTALVSTANASLQGLVAGDSVTVATNGAFADKNAGTGKTVALTSTYGGADAANYTILGQTSTTASITPKVLGISGLSVANKVYDGSTAASLTGGTLSGLVGNETLSLGGLAGSFADKNAGADKAVTVNGQLADGSGLASNYTLAQPTGLSGTITPKALTMSGITALDKTYDGSTSANVSTAGASLQGLVVGDNVTVSTSGSFANKNAGIGKTITLTSTYGGTDAGNYTIQGQGTTTASITPKALTVSGITALDKTYDGTTGATVSTASAGLQGLVAGDNVTVSASGSFTDKNAGSGKAVALTASYGGADAANYTIQGQATTTASITPKALTVSGITAADKVYDGSTSASVSAANASLQGLVAGDKLTLSAVGAFLDKNVGNAKTVTLNSTVSGTDAANYAIKGQATATASITPKALTVSGITAVDKTYDGTTTATVSTTGAALQGLVAGDSVALSAGGSFADKNAGSNKQVNLVDTVHGADAGNYAVTTQSTTTASIAPKSLSVTGTLVADKTADGNTSATLTTPGVLVGVVTNDSVNLNDSAATAQFSQASAGKGIAVNVSGLALSGTDASNYAFTGTATTIGNIRSATPAVPEVALPASPAASVMAATIAPQNQGVVSVLQAPAVGGMAYLAVPDQATADAGTGATTMAANAGPLAGGSADGLGEQASATPSVSATERRQSSSQATGNGRNVKFLNVLVVSGGIRMPGAGTTGGQQNQQAPGN